MYSQIVKNQIYLQLQIQQYLLEFHILIGKRKVKYQVVAPRLFFLNMEETRRAERTDLEDKGTDVES